AAGRLRPRRDAPRRRGARGARGPVAGPCRVGAHPAGAVRRRGQRVRGRAPAGAAPQVAPAEAAEAPAPALQPWPAAYLSTYCRLPVAVTPTVCSPYRCVAKGIWTWARSQIGPATFQASPGTAETTRPPVFSWGTPADRSRP